MSTTEAYNRSLALSTDDQLASSKIFGDYPEGLLKFASVCCMLFMVIGIPGNLITIIALARYKKVRNATAIFIINLSLCDLLYCCFDLPLAASTFWRASWPHGTLLCRLFPLTRFALAAVALFTVSAITTNRYILISHPRLYSKLYKLRNLAAILISIWAFSFGSLIPTWLEKWGRFGMDPATGLCSLIPDQNNRSPAVLLFLCAFIIPCITIMVCYARIMCIVRKTTTRLSTVTRKKRRTVFEDLSFGTSTAERSPTSDNENIVIDAPAEHPRVQSLRFSAVSQDRSTDLGNARRSLRVHSARTTVLLRQSQAPIRSLPSSKDKRLLTMITAIMLSFLICHLPITVIKVCQDLLKPHPVAFIISSIIRYLTTCINPVIYVLMSNEYRRAYKKLLLIPTCRDRVCYHWR